MPGLGFQLCSQLDASNWLGRSRILHILDVSVQVKLIQECYGRNILEMRLVVVALLGHWFGRCSPLFTVNSGPRVGRKPATLRQVPSINFQWRRKCIAKSMTGVTFFLTWWLAIAVPVDVARALFFFFLTSANLTMDVAHYPNFKVCEYSQPVKRHCRRRRLLVSPGDDLPPSCTMNSGY